MIYSGEKKEHYNTQIHNVIRQNFEKSSSVMKLIFNCSQPLQPAMLFGKFSVLSSIFN